MPSPFHILSAAAGAVALAAHFSADARGERQKYPQSAGIAEGPVAERFPWICGRIPVRTLPRTSGPGGPASGYFTLFASLLVTPCALKNLLFEHKGLRVIPQNGL
jgi:hypothetical protein